MDGIFAILVIFGIVNSIVKWAKKQQASQNRDNQGAAPDKPWQRMLGELSQSMEGAIPGKQQPVKRIVSPIRVHSPTAKTWQEGEGGGEGTISEQSSFTTMAPSVQDTVHIAPSPEQWHGSIPGPSEYEAFTPRKADVRVEAEPALSAPGLSFGRDSLMQAVIMHEILTRPQERKRRCRYH